MSILSPLCDFYESLGLPFPLATRIAPNEMPDLYRRLLVHDDDMTPTLELAHGSTIHLEVLDYSVDYRSMKRLVVLRLDDDRRVEMGAIRIFLNELPDDARTLVLERKQPFGTIVDRTKVSHLSRPTDYFQVRSDHLISNALGAPEGETLYGRRNTIWSPEGALLAEVVEILPL